VPALVPLVLLAAAASLLAAGCMHGHRTRLQMAREAVANEIDEQVPRWVRAERLPRAAIPGAHIFAQSGCTACHTYLGSGARNVGARDLSSAGRAHRVRFFERYVANPARFGNNVMPAFSALGRRRLHELAVFLAASKGKR
jgi:cytochrome c5